MGNNTQSLLMDGSVPVVARTPLFQTPRPGFPPAASELTPAQRKAVEFAQQQILRAQQSQRRQSQHAADATGFAKSAKSKATCPTATTISFRHILGEVLRSLRTKDHKTLREVSQKAGVSLGYLSEVERGQKEASSELLGSISSALGMRLSQTLRLVADEVERVESDQGLATMTLSR